MTGHQELRELMGPYVLGGLSADDRRAFEAHLETCATCREDVLRHASVPGLLRTGVSLPAIPPGPEPDVLPRLLDAVAHDRAVRRRRALAGGMLAAALVVVALALGLRDDNGPVLPDEPVTVIALAPAGTSSATGEGALIRKGWGTEIQLSAAALPGDGPFRLVVISPDGSRQLAATWGPTPGGEARVTGATWLKPGDIAAVQVLDPSGAVLRGATG